MKVIDKIKKEISETTPENILDVMTDIKYTHFGCQTCSGCKITKSGDYPHTVTKSMCCGIGHKKYMESEAEDEIN